MFKGPMQLILLVFTHFYAMAMFQFALLIYLRELILISSNDIDRNEATRY